MVADQTLAEARQAFKRGAWRAARSALRSLNSDVRLTADDLESLAIAEHLLGEEEESRDALARGFSQALEQRDVTRAVRFAFWLAHSMIFTDELHQANGWINRARSLLSQRGADCVEWGYLMIPPAVQQLFSGDTSSACSTFTEALAIGRRFSDPSLIAMASHCRARALIRLGLASEAMTALDEIMVAVATREVSPLSVGHVYCGVLEACQEVLDLGRAREWTAVFSRWCEGQEDLIAYQGPCLVHRAELMRILGDWDNALDEARRACDWLSLPSSPEGPADAFYQLGELHRLRGESIQAQDDYRQASRFGRLPQPGLGLLKLSIGEPDAARAMLSGALNDADLPIARRAELIASLVEIVLAQKDIQSAKNRVSELATLANSLDVPSLRAMAQWAEGRVLLASGEARAALGPLRSAWLAWKQLDVPYECARVREQLGYAYIAMGDEASGAMELDAARWIYERLNAAPDLARMDSHAVSSESRPMAGLSQREIEVLRLIAAGETNKAIAAALIISEHTVARHVQNMLQKLGVSSRTSLAAFAVERGLAHPLTG